MAERLAELGADVAIHDISWTAPAKYGEAPDLDAVAKEIARHGGRVAAVSGNIGDKAAVAKMKQEIEAKLGTVDILVNCAGGDIGASGGKPDPNDALGIPLEDIRALTENNLYGTILVCQAFVPPMVKAGSGSVINIASAAAHFGVTNGVIYAALKAAVVHYTRCLAKELQDAGRAGQCREPGRDQDGALPGDARRRPEDDGLVDRSRSFATPSRPRSRTRSRSWRAREASSSTVRSCGSTAARRCFRDDRKKGGRRTMAGERFEGMTAVVTGGASGIGFAVSRRFVGRRRTGQRCGTSIKAGLTRRRRSLATGASPAASTSPIPTTSNARPTRRGPRWAASTRSSAAPAWRERTRS